MQKVAEEFAGIEDIVKSGIFGNYNYHVIRKFVLIGVKGKKLEPQKVIRSPFGNQGNRYFFTIKSVHEYRKHLVKNNLL